MVRKRFENLDAETQERIFAAAAAEFAERGYEAASINRILAAAEMSKGSLYYYFEDKADLFAAVVERATAGMLAAAGGLALEELTAENYWDRLGELARRSGEFLSQHDWAARLLRAMLRAPGGPAGAGIAAAAERWTAAILGRGQELGVVRGDLPFAMLASMALALGEAGDRWLLEHWEEFSPAELERLAAGQIDIFRRMLAAAA
ncbi:MAG TPA: helix-turn-helix domain-containing protein [Herpetosiphonaceae bacterium]|nr:helix-turn-helix domain-containing protein [Herpetosiphonaceae bacterium]